jgi:hypothetical protein
MSPNSDKFKVQNESLLPQPAMVPQCQLPGKVNVDPRFDIDSISHFRPEKTKYPAFETTGPRKRAEEKKAFHQIPDCLHALAPPTLKADRSVKLIKSGTGHSGSEGLRQAETDVMEVFGDV